LRSGGKTKDMISHQLSSRFQVSTRLVHLILTLALSLAGARLAVSQEIPKEVTAHLGTSKIVVYKDDVKALKTAGALKARHVIDYPDRKIYIVRSDDLAPLSAEQRKVLSIRDNLNKIFLRGGAIDTTKPIPPVPKELALSPSPGPQLYLLQFAGPIKEEWLEEVRKQGNIERISYLANNAYLIRADGPAVGKLRSMVARQTFCQFLGPYHPAYRMHPALHPGGAEQVKVTVQFVDHDRVAESVAFVKGKAKKVLRDAWVVRLPGVPMWSTWSPGSSQSCSGSARDRSWPIRSTRQAPNRSLRVISPG
jgi:hypothetical protein